MSINKRVNRDSSNNQNINQTVNQESKIPLSAIDFSSIRFKNSTV